MFFSTFMMVLRASFIKGNRKSYINYEIPAFGRQRLGDPESLAIVPSTPKFPITS